ncbi:MAG: LETM1-related biofilm-associated protein [Fluviicola sp.]|nr:LETM1-related biofilm-associated protein [Fluviicola sp.]
MLSPGSKGWMAKYFQLVESKQVVLRWEQPDALPTEQFNHHFLAQSGIVFGYPSQLLFGKELDQTKWTKNEKLTVLLFEAQLFTYMRVRRPDSFEPEVFIDELTKFYKNHKIKSLSSLIGYFFKESKEEKLERILAKRTEVPKNIVHTKSWMSYLNNAFVYLDVLLFEEFLLTEGEMRFDYQELAMLALAVITLSAYSDGELEEKEKTIFEAFLVSAELDGDEREIARLRFKEGSSLNELTSELIDSWYYKRYLLDLSSLTIYSNHDAAIEEKVFLQELCAWLQLEEINLDEALVSSNQFVLENNQQVAFLHDASSVELMVDNVSKRWIKILGRNKDKLAVELRQSKELVQLIRKSSKEELSKEEKEKVKTQFMDIVKSMPALAIFLLPGGALLLPIVLKIIPNLVPSAFRENEIESQSTPKK